MKKITFSKPVEEIRRVAEALLDDELATPAEVGEACFQAALNRLPKPKRKA